jgi:hypothetical protein
MAAKIYSEASSIPTGLCNSAQGCEHRAALGKGRKPSSTPTGLWRSVLVASWGLACTTLGNRRYSRLAVCATSVTPIANRLYRGLPVRLGFSAFRLALGCWQRIMVGPCERDEFTSGCCKNMSFISISIGFVWIV